jgi:hypothetical protein
MSRKKALALLGFKETDNPSFDEIGFAANAKIVQAFKGKDSKQNVDLVIALCDAQKELQKGLPKEATPPTALRTKPAKPSKPKKRKVSWLLWLGIPITASAGISTFLTTYFLAPALFGLPQVASALLIAASATTGAALLFAITGASLALLNFMATRKYDSVLTTGAGVSEKMLTALNLGLKSKAWEPYFVCFTKGVTYQFPLAYRAGISYATTCNQEKIHEIESYPHIRLNKQPIV